MAIESQSAAIVFNLQTVGEVISIGGPGGTSPVINVTALSDTSAQKLTGVLDEGSVTLECNYVPDDAGQIACNTARLARTAHETVITYSDANTATFNAFCTGYVLSGGVGAQVKLSITLEVTGAVNYTAN